MKTTINILNYQFAFELFLKDFTQVLEFIEPVNENSKTFSHRIYGLLLRVCTEFESLAKDLLIESGSKKSPQQMDVRDYKTLEPSLCLESVKVDFLLWQPNQLSLKPFEKWSTSKPALSWYSKYNTVKHNRATEFKQANLNTLIEAGAGLFAIIAKVCNFKWNEDCWSKEAGKYTYRYLRMPFCMYGV